MTKKHFIDITRIISEFRHNAHMFESPEIMLESMIQELCVEFRLINPKFDAAKFKAAIGV